MEKRVLRLENEVSNRGIDEYQWDESKLADRIMKRYLKETKAIPRRGIAELWYEMMNVMVEGGMTEDEIYEQVPWMRSGGESA